MALLDVRGLRARYGEVEVIRGLNFSVERGAIVALLGSNGAGKTSTLRAIGGSVKTAGSVIFDGKPLHSDAPEEAARRGIAHVPEGRGTLGAFTVWENLALGAYTHHDRKSVRTQHERVVEYFPWLAERSKQIAGTLSGGEQAMLAIARALMMDPQLILLDEPSLGLAPLVVRRIFELLRRINERDGVSILVAEQNATIALATAGYAYVLETGRIVARGRSDELAKNDQIRKSYLGE